MGREEAKFLPTWWITQAHTRQVLANKNRQVLTLDTQTLEHFDANTWPGFLVITAECAYLAQPKAISLYLLLTATQVPSVTSAAQTPCSCCAHTGSCHYLLNVVMKSGAGQQRITLHSRI